MPYTPDATEITQPADVGVGASTAAAEFRAIKLYLRDVLLAGLSAKAPLVSPIFTTPNLGTPSAGVLTNCTGTAAGLTAGYATAAGSAGSATTATHLAGGAIGSIPYQTASGTTAFLAAGAATYLLTANGANPPYWAAGSGGGGMVYPPIGIPVSTGASWGTSKATPTGALVGTSDTQTLTNKTLDLSSNTLSTTLGQLNSAVSDADLASLDGFETLSNKTILSPALNNTNITGVKCVAFDSEYNNGNSGTAKTITLANGMRQKLTLTGNLTLTISFTNAAVGTHHIRLIQDAAGSRTLANIVNLSTARWLGSTSQPTIVSTANGETWLSIAVVTAGSSTGAVASMSKIGAV